MNNNHNKYGRRKRRRPLRQRDAAPFVIQAQYLDKGEGEV